MKIGPITCTVDDKGRVRVKERDGWRLLSRGTPTVYDDEVWTGKWVMWPWVSDLVDRGMCRRRTNSPARTGGKR